MTRVVISFCIGFFDGVMQASMKASIVAATILIVGVLMNAEVTRPPALPGQLVALPGDVFEPVRAMQVEFQVLTARCHWALASEVDIACNGTLYEGRDLINARLPSSLVEKAEGDHDLVSIGAASFEGWPEQEARRALERAKNMAQWAWERANFNGNVWVINMGQFRGDCGSCAPGDSSAQRPVILAIIAHQDDAEAVQALIKRELLSESKKPGSTIPNPHDYTQFDIQRLK
jgi:hypothetical protein